MFNREQSLDRRENINAMLVQSVERQDYFADDVGDEFRIIREDGQPQGIFKVWASQVIASLEGMDTQEWADSLRDKPLSLFESLESWRAFSSSSDRSLQKIFDSQPLPETLESQAAELFSRLITAFAVSAPFYHIEALVADNRPNRTDNPIEFSNEEIVAGKLDAVAMLLPAAAKNILVAAPENWGDLSWEKIRVIVQNLQDDLRHDLDKPGDDQGSLIRNIILKIAVLASISVEDVIFAANALEFIPDHVGGKSADFSQDEAIKLLNEVLNKPQPEVTTTTIAKDMNALIRFLNWTPAIKSNANFSGKNWTYDSVCATAGQLLKLILDNTQKFFGEEFSNTFRSRLAPQLEHIDATSAKGRFLLQVLREGKFLDEVNQQIQETINRRVPELFEGLSNEQLHIDFNNFTSISQTGGKAAGLRTAIEIFGEDNVVRSKVLPNKVINDWLITIPNVRQLLEDLERNVNGRADIAEKIRRHVIDAEAPREILEEFVIAICPSGTSKLAFRSSSFDEDADVIGPAPGIYESVIDIDPNDIQAVGTAFKSVVASFFTAKAVHFRDLKCLRHKPVMAVLGQQMLDGPGGTMFIQNGIRTINIADSPSKINNLESKNNIETIELMPHQNINFSEVSMIPTHALRLLDKLARQAQDVLGPVDIEFVFDPKTDKITILQLRRLERVATIEQAKQHLGKTALLPVSRLEELDAIDGDPIRLVIGATDDVEKFQGELFRSILKHRHKIAGIVIPRSLPPTCHFVNILMTMGITIETEGES